MEGFNSQSLSYHCSSSLTFVQLLAYRKFAGTPSSEGHGSAVGAAHRTGAVVPILLGDRGAEQCRGSLVITKLVRSETRSQGRCCRTV